MPSIYLTENLHNKQNGISPWRYVGSDQHDNKDYLGSSRDLQQDINILGKENFSKTILQYYSIISNKDLRKLEAEYLQTVGAKYDVTYYNKSQTYSPGCGVKGMKHKKSKPRSQAWKNSRAGWVPSESTRATWSRQRTGRKATELQRQERSNRLCGSGNPNAVVWDIIDPTGNVIRVTGLRGYCRDNNLPFGWIYHSKNGWKSIKYGTGKGGRRKKV